MREDPSHLAETVPELLQPRSTKPKAFGIGREPNDRPRYDAAMVALIASRHVPEAMRTIAELITNADRASVRLKAATTMIELACGMEASEEAQGTKVFVLATAPDTKAGQASTSALADELRKRLGSAK